MLTFELIFAIFVFVYLLSIVATLPMIATVTVLPFFTLTVVLVSLGAVDTTTLQVSFLPVVSVAVTVAVPLLSAVILPSFTVATFWFDVVQDFTVPPTAFNVLLPPDFRKTFDDVSFGEEATVTLQVSFSPVERVAVIVAVPLLTAVTLPLLTVATFLFEVDQDFTVPSVTFKVLFSPALSVNCDSESFDGL